MLKFIMDALSGSDGISRHNQRALSSNFLRFLIARIAKYPFEMVLLIVISACLAITHSSLLGFYDYYGYDQWFFVYSGQAILDGTIPYLGFWDNKPPLIYFLNAAGLLLGRGSVWGVCVLNALFFAFATGVSFIFLSKAFGRRSAVFGCCVWLMTALWPFDGGNGVTDYALPFIFMTWLWYFQLVSTKSFGRYAFLWGMTAGVLFLLKPTFIGTHLAMTLPASIYLYRNGRWRLMFECLLWAFCGAVLILSVPTIYLLYHHAFAAFVDQVFTFPSHYLVSSTSEDWMRDLEFGLKMLKLPIILGCVGLLAIMVRLHKPGDLTSAQKWLVFAVVIVMPTEMCLSCLSGRPWRHYFLTWIPFLAILSTFAVSAFFRYQWLERQSLPEVNTFTASVIRTLRQLLPVLALMTVLAVIVTMPTQLFLACVSERLSWSHYFRVCLPLFAILWTVTAIAFFRYRGFGKQICQGGDTLTVKVVWILRLLVPIVVVVTLAIMPVKNSVSLFEHRTVDFPHLIEFLEAYSGAERSIFSWGATLKVNVQLHKPSPDRFATQEPFFIKGYTTSAMVADLIASVRDKKPIIVDTSFYAGGVVPSLPPNMIRIKGNPVFAGFGSWGQTPEIKKSMGAFYRMIANDYRVIALSRKEQWVVLENKSYLSDPNSGAVHRLSELRRNAPHDGGVYIFNPGSYIQSNTSS